MPRFSFALACAAIVAALVLAAAARTSAAAPAACSESGYGYAGLVSEQRVHGVSASVTAVTQPHVASGHAAGWVGVGGAEAGPNGEAEWIQAGIAAFPGRGLRLYVELFVPGRQRQFFDLGAARVGEQHRFVVAELANRPGWWQAVVDGRAMQPIFLPGSSGAWRGVATAETWTAAGRPCNRYGYRFDAVLVQTTAGWTQPQPRTHLRDAGHRLSVRTDGLSAAA